MKRFIILFFVLIIILSCTLYGYANSFCKNEITLQLNEEYQNKFFPDSMKSGNVSDRLIFDVYNNENIVLHFLLDAETEKKVNLSKIDDLHVSELGIITLYDGYLNLENDGEKYVSVMITTTKDGVFVIVNMGIASEDEKPETYIYGNYSSSTKSIMEEYSKVVQDNNNQENSQHIKNENDIKDTKSYDSTIVYSNSLSLYAGGYNLGALHLYRNAQAEAGGKESVFGKVNSNISGAQYYVQNILHPTNVFNYVSPLRVYLNLKTTNYSVYTIYYGSSSPDPVTNSYYNPISFSIGSPISVGIGVPDIVVSSITRSYSNNQCNWIYYKALTFGNIDGGYSASTGLVARVSFYADGYTPSSVTEYAMGTAKIQYQYSVSSGGDTIVSTFIVGNLDNWVMGAYTIVPN